MDKDFYDAGRIQLYREVLLAILRQYSEPERAVRLARNVAERELVRALNERQVPDRYVDGIQDALSVLEQTLRDISDE